MCIEPLWWLAWCVWARPGSRRDTCSRLWRDSLWTSWVALVRHRYGCCHRHRHRHRLRHPHRRRRRPHRRRGACNRSHHHHHYHRTKSTYVRASSPRSRADGALCPPCPGRRRDAAWADRTTGRGQAAAATRSACCACRTVRSPARWFVYFFILYSKWCRLDLKFVVFNKWSCDRSVLTFWRRLSRGLPCTPWAPARVGSCSALAKLSAPRVPSAIRAAWCATRRARRYTTLWACSNLSSCCCCVCHWRWCLKLTKRRSCHLTKTNSSSDAYLIQISHLSLYIFSYTWTNRLFDRSETPAPAALSRRHVGFV